MPVLLGTPDIGGGLGMLSIIGKGRELLGVHDFIVMWSIALYRGLGVQKGRLSRGTTS